MGADWPWEGTGWGTSKFDLTQFAPEYFQRLRSRVLAAGERGIYVSVMLFEGWGREGPHLWVKRPWTRANYWEDWMKEDSVAPYGGSARIDQVFINEEPLQWVPSREELNPVALSGGQRPRVANS